MFGRLMPREGNFFELFNAHADKIAEGSRELAAMMTTFSELELHAQHIDGAERAADKVTHETITLLHKTFITPFDRDQIHSLITRMDDILDLIEDVAHSMFLYDIRVLSPEAKNLADICAACVLKVKDAVGLLSKMDDAARVMSLCEEIDRLEADADHVMRAAMAKLFREQPDALEVIKLKEIYELLESVTDRCEDVANVIEGIVLERA